MTWELFFFAVVLFQIKHFICDFPLQNSYMLGKFKERGWVLPLASHAAVHVVGTLVTLTVFQWIAGLGTWSLIPSLALLDGVIHFAIDRIKASPKLLGRYKPNEPEFWYCLGADQMAHHITHYVLLAVFIASGARP